MFKLTSIHPGFHPIIQFLIPGVCQELGRMPNPGPDSEDTMNKLRSTKGVLFILGCFWLCALVYLTHVALPAQKNPNQLAWQKISYQGPWQNSNNHHQQLEHERRPALLPTCSLLDEEDEEEEDEEEAEEEADNMRKNKDMSQQSGKTTTNLFHMKPPVFLKSYKNPCWIEQLTSAAPYDNNIYTKRSSLGNKYQSLQAYWKRRLAKGKDTRLRCLPYYYIAGMPKCGTTELYYKLARHPYIFHGDFKEPHWWTRKRTGAHPPAASFRDYVDLFDKEAECIRRNGGNPFFTRTNAKRYHGMIVGEGSASTLWDNRLWHHLAEKTNETETEPQYLTADYMHYIQPGARIIVILRNPTDRLWSDFLFFEKGNHGNKTQKYFDKKVQQAIQHITICLKERSIRSCLSNYTLSTLFKVRLDVGMYHAHLAEWLRIFPREQIYVLRLEDYSSDRMKHLNNIVEFLGLDPYPEDIARNIMSSSTRNIRPSEDRKRGDMWESTRSILQDFYRPYNIKLANLLKDPIYLLWND